MRTLFFPLLFYLASALVRNSIEAMKEDGVDEVCLGILWLDPHLNTICHQLDRSGNRIRQLRSTLTLWIAWLYPWEEASPILLERQGRVPAHPWCTSITLWQQLWHEWVIFPEVFSRPFEASRFIPQHSRVGLFWWWWWLRIISLILICLASLDFLPYLVIQPSNCALMFCRLRLRPLYIIVLYWFTLVVL